MKKVILIAIAVFGFTFANAQQTKFGLKGGMNIANFSGDIEENSSKVSFHAGGFAEIKISDKFSIQPELLYSEQGTKMDGLSEVIDFTTYTADISFRLSYINIPVMFKFYVDKSFYFELGPQLGILTGAKTITKISGFNQEAKQDVKDFFKSTDFGLNFGAGYDFTNHLFANVRYNLGLANIAETVNGDDSKIKNSNFMLSIGYKF